MLMYFLTPHYYYSCQSIYRAKELPDQGMVELERKLSMIFQGFLLGGILIVAKDGIYCNLFIY